MLLQPVHEAIVRGNLRRGVRPYVNLYGVRYSSSVLGEASGRIGNPLRIYFDPEDMRVVAAFLASGEEIGPLRAARPWDPTPHSLRLRQEILRLKRLKEIDYGDLLLRRRLNETRHREISEARRRCLSRADRAECVSDRTRDAAKVNARVVAHLMGSTTNVAPVVETGAVSLERGVDAMSRRRFAWRHSPRFIATTDLFAIRSAEPQEPVT